MTRYQNRMCMVGGSSGRTTRSVQNRLPYTYGRVSNQHRTVLLDKDATREMIDKVVITGSALFRQQMVL